MQPIQQPSVRNYNNVGTRNNGFQYRIMPLSFNLQQRGNSTNRCIVTRCIFNIGDTVSGTCIYIMDLSTRMVLPVKADTAKILSQKLVENYSFDKSISKLKNKSLK